MGKALWFSQGTRLTTSCLLIFRMCSRGTTKYIDAMGFRFLLFVTIAFTAFSTAEIANECLGVIYFCASRLFFFVLAHGRIRCLECAAEMCSPSRIPEICEGRVCHYGECYKHIWVQFTYKNEYEKVTRCSIYSFLL